MPQARTSESAGEACGGSRARRDSTARPTARNPWPVQLLGIFDEHYEREWDLLCAQLRDAWDETDHPRRKLDAAVADIVFEDGAEPGDEPVDLDGLYADLYETLELLRAVMS